MLKVNFDPRDTSVRMN